MTRPADPHPGPQVAVVVHHRAADPGVVADPDVGPEDVYSPRTAPAPTGSCRR